MHNSELFRLYVSAGKSFNQANLLEGKLVSKTDNSTNPQVEPMPYEALILAPVCFMIVWAIVVFTVAEVYKVAQNKDGIVKINVFKQVTCKNCHFFNNNYYLKCVLHPSTVLTKQALNCCDYRPR